MVANARPRENGVSPIFSKIVFLAIFCYNKGMKKELAYSFLLGVARGVGFAFGASLIFALIIWLLSKLVIIPFFGDWIVNLLDYVQKTRAY